LPELGEACPCCVRGGRGRNVILWAAMAPTTTCTICQHPKRHSIEVALTHKTPLRVIAARFDCSLDAVFRHGKHHLSPQMRAAILTAQKPTAVDLEALQISESEGLLAQLISQRARLQAHSDQALELGDTRAATAAERAILANLELVGRLLGTLVVRHEVKRTSILISADYLQLRSALLKALRPYPEAARAVGQALHMLETEAAKEIAAADRRPPMIEAVAAVQ
jgi:hypothetical protein